MNLNDMVFEIFISPFHFVHARKFEIVLESINEPLSQVQ